MAMFCSICKRKMGVMTGKVHLADGWICSSCYENAGMSRWSTKELTAAREITTMNFQRIICGLKPLTEEDRALMPFRAANSQRVNSFIPTYQIDNLIAFDDVNMEFCCGSQDLVDLFKYQNIVDYELIESVGSVSKGSAGSALVGGALFGTTGAIIGAAASERTTIKECDSLCIKITLRETYRPLIYINFISQKTMTNSAVYKEAFDSAQKCMSLLKLACDKVRLSQSQIGVSHSTADELRKFKQLLDDGIITEEEFLRKKALLLGI